MAGPKFEDAFETLRAAGYKTPMTTLEDGVCRYIQKFIGAQDQYR